MSDFCGIKWLERGHGMAYTPPPPGGPMTQARWFEGAKLNFAHNLLPPPTDDEVGVGAVTWTIATGAVHPPKLSTLAARRNRQVQCAR